MAETDFTTLTELECPLLEQPTNDMCMGDLIKLLAFNTAVLERMVANSIVPAGIVSYFSGQESDVPPRFLICDGSYFDPSTYPELFAKIKYTYGRDVDNCFAVPDLRVSIIQGVALGSECMDEDEAVLWEGRNPAVGAAVQGNVVGSRIKFPHNPVDPLNPVYFNSTNAPQVGDSIYGKMSLIPVISTGELCGRYEIQSPSTTGCTTLSGGSGGSGVAGMTLVDDELCIIAPSGAIAACIDLSSLNNGVSTGVSADTTSVVNLFKKEYVAPTLITSDVGIASVDLNTLAGVTVPSWATHAIVKGRAGGFMAGNTNAVLRARITAGGIEVVEAVGGDDGVTPQYTLGGKAVISDINGSEEEVTISESNIISAPLNGSNLSYELSTTGSAGIYHEYTHLYILGFEGVEPTTVEGIGVGGKQVYYAGDGVSAWNANISALVDLNTIVGVTVPSWATHTIVYGIFNSEGVATNDVTIGGRTLSQLTSLSGHSQHTGEYTIPLDGTSLQVDMTLAGSSTADVYILGFKNIY